MNQKLRESLLHFLEKPHTHMAFGDAVRNFPSGFINKKPKGVPYSFWELLEHIRITQRDIIDFLGKADYKEMEWPQDYWPKPGAKATKAMWNKTIKEFKKDFEVLKRVAKNPKKDLLALDPVRGSQIFRGAVQIMGHNSYHLGEFVLMRRAMGIWKN